MELIKAILIIFPAYVANASAVVVGGGTPIDFGKKWRGKPIFGKGKTWKGFIGGCLCGMITGYLINHFTLYFGDGCKAFTVIFALSFGALVGDLIKSFIKRRIGKERGEKWIVADQIDFLLGAFLFTYILNKSWFITNFKLHIILFLLVITPAIHLATNIIAYLLKLKKVPW